MRLGPITLAIAVVASACADDEEPRGAPLPLVAATYNLANPAGDRVAAIADHVIDLSPDILGLQECGDCAPLVELLPPSYELTAEAFAGVGLLIDSSTWRVSQRGRLELGVDDDGWGPRVAVWADLVNRESGHPVRAYSTHWCVTVRRADDACDVDRQLAYANTLLDHASNAGSPVIVAGDLNVFDGFEDSEPVAALLDAGLVDGFRELHPDADGTTFDGTSWAPPGRIDYVLASEPVRILDAAIDRGDLATAAASDHRAATVDLVFE